MSKYTPASLTDTTSSITVIGRRWFDRVNGNTYFTASILVDGKQVHSLPRQYGHGNHYLTVATEWLEKEGYIKREHRSEPLWQVANREGFILHYEAIDVQRKKDL